MVSGESSPFFLCNFFRTRHRVISGWYANHSHWYDSNPYVQTLPNSATCFAKNIKPPVREKHNLTYKTPSTPLKIKFCNINIVFITLKQCNIELRARPLTKLAQSVTILICIPKVRRSKLNQYTGYPKEVLRGFPQPYQANSGIIPQIKPLPLLPTTVPIHYSIVILAFDIIYSELLMSFIKGKYINK
jgi:hypothetical protein